MAEREPQMRGRHRAGPEVLGERRALIQEEQQALRSKRWATRKEKLTSAWHRAKDRAAAVLPVSAVATLAIAGPAAAVTEAGNTQDMSLHSDSGYSVRLPQVPTGGIDLEAQKASIPGFTTHKIESGDTLAEIAQSDLATTALSPKAKKEMLGPVTVLSAAASPDVERPDRIFPGEEARVPDEKTIQVVYDAMQGKGPDNVVAAVEDLEVAATKDYGTAVDEGKRALTALDQAYQQPSPTVQRDGNEPFMPQEDAQQDTASLPKISNGTATGFGAGLGFLGVAAAASAGLLGGQLRRMRKEDNREVALRAEHTMVTNDALTEVEVGSIAKTLSENPLSNRAARRERLDGAQLISEYGTTNPENIESILNTLGVSTPELMAVVETYKKTDHPVEVTEDASFGIPTRREVSDALILKHEIKGFTRRSVYTLHVEKRTTGLSLQVQQPEQEASPVQREQSLFQSATPARV